MKIKNMVRAFLGANLLLLVSFAFLPALLFNPDLESYQAILNYINKE
ncbi:hypothetical protein [Sporosarcina sp. G11-34]|nr:hypothetical protein [Sporosarcina sp. G11-34]MCZ2257830.1 hypothetical protein [Sporosarcina sp. G11-34]